MDEEKGTRAELICYSFQHIMRKSDDLGHKVGIKFMTYSTGSWSNPFKDKSGAYIFMPDGPAQVGLSLEMLLLLLSANFI